jgi:glycosyltransferase involved in cell wall biosynthesis
MKILQLGKAFSPIKKLGGVEKVMEYFYHGLNEFGIQCDVLGCNDKFSSKIDNYSGNGLIYREPLLFKAKSTFFSINLIFKLWKIQNNYDIIHVHLPDPMALIALFLTRPKTKIIIHWHSNILKQKNTYLLVKYFEKWLLKRSNAILCTTPKYYLDNNILEPFKNKTSYIVIGLNKEELLFNKELYSKIKEIDVSNKKIIYVGRFVYYKGLEYLIQAMSQVESDCKLYLIGLGPLEYKLRSLVADLNINDSVIFLGELNDEDKFAHIKSSKILILPSIYKTEAYGIVQIEAMAFGVPVISTKIQGSGVDWVNMDNISGLTVLPKDSAEIAKSIDKILIENELYDKLSMGATSRFNSMFTKQIMINELILKYKEFIKS